MENLWPWIAFNAFILLMLALDLGVFNRKSHEVSVKEAGIWVAVWVTMAAIFNAGVYYFMGFDKGLQFTTGYLIEQMLSIDNMFVFVLIMSAFCVPKQYQHRLLFFGILGALIMRGAMIAAGVYLTTHFHWIFYVFGIFLIYTAYRMVSEKESIVIPQHNPLVRWVSSHFPVLNDFRGNHFFVKEEIRGKLRWAATPLLLALICIEFTDLVFALDSVPAIFAITEDPFIIYSSNVFAILGLRSMYFLLAHAITQFKFLKHGVALVLAFVGLKMLTKDVFHIEMTWSLVFILCVIALSVGLSLVQRRLERDKEA